MSLCNLCDSHYRNDFRGLGVPLVVGASITGMDLDATGT